MTKQSKIDPEKLQEWPIDQLEGLADGTLKNIKVLKAEIEVKEQQVKIMFDNIYAVFKVIREKRAKHSGEGL